MQFGGNSIPQVSYLLNSISGFASYYWHQDRLTKVWITWIAVLVLFSLFGPTIAPYEFNERLYDADGGIIRSEAPSLAHPLGTTDSGYDVLSRVIYGAQPTAITGFLGGFIIISIGLFVGVTSGYMGGRIDDVLMRITDLMYSIPVLIFALVLIAFVGTGFLTSIVIIGLLLWRQSARVLRSQVIQIRQRPFILAANATGASNTRIITRHILPNIIPMATVFFAIGVGVAIIIQAGLAFIGVANPFVPSWGIMVRNAYNAGIGNQIWWGLVPGFLISITVLSTFMLGRKFEEHTEANIAAV